MTVIDLKTTDRIARNTSNPKLDVRLNDVMLPLEQGPTDFFIPKPRRTSTPHQSRMNRASTSETSIRLAIDTRSSMPCIFSATGP